MSLCILDYGEKESHDKFFNNVYRNLDLIKNINKSIKLKGNKEIKAFKKIMNDYTIGRESETFQKLCIIRNLFYVNNDITKENIRYYLILIDKIIKLLEYNESSIKKLNRL